MILDNGFDAQTWRVIMRMETMTKEKMKILARLVIPCVMQGGGCLGVSRNRQSTQMNPFTCRKPWSGRGAVMTFE
jgi:hypothetical protein